MQWTNEEMEEWLDYVFQLKYNRVEHTYNRLEQKRGWVSRSIPSKRGKDPQSKNTVSDDDAIMEFELAIATFARPDSWYNVDRWLKFLRNLAGENHSSKFDEMERELQEIRKGKIELTLQKKITDYKAYEMIALQVVFADDLEANTYEQFLLRHDQKHQLLWKKYQVDPSFRK